MSGPSAHDNNRFWELGSPGCKKNRKRIRTEEFIQLTDDTTVDDEQLPRFLVASTIPPKDASKHIPLAAHNVFQIGRGIDHISPNYLDISEMKSGDLLIKVADKKTAEKFIRATHIDCVPVKITLHQALNSSQGKVFCERIINLPEEEIIKWTKHVIGVRKITKKEGDKFVPTGAAILTFDLVKCPKKTKIGWQRVTVKNYIPNPMRCVKCQKLGHTKNRCHAMEKCRECAYPPPHDSCSRKYCVNCEIDTHTSYDSECPSYWKYKSVNNIRIKNRCTNREAWQIFNDNPAMNTLTPESQKVKKMSYAQAAAINTNNASDDSPKNKNNGTTETQAKTIENNNETNTKKTKSTHSTKTCEEEHNSSTKSLSRAQNTNNNELYLDNSLVIENSQIDTNTSKSSFTQRPRQKETLDKYNSTTTDNDNNIDINLSLDYNYNSDDPEIMKSPPRSSVNTNDDNSNPLTPCSKLYKKFPELNVIITPNTLKKTLPNNHN